MIQHLAHTLCPLTWQPQGLSTVVFSQLLATSADWDPEVRAALLSRQQGAPDADLYGEPELF